MTIINSFFNAAFYLKQNLDVAEAVANGQMTVEEHFELYGKFEGRAPNASFNPTYYLESNPDVAAAVEQGFTTAQDHFNQYGKFEGRTPSPLFDPEFYLAQSPDVAAAIIESGGALTAYDHFMSYGFNEARAINPAIHLGDYLKANPDVAEAVQMGYANAFDHLTTYGIHEGRDLGNGVSLKQFANDPAFNVALESGNISDAIAIVVAVSPFLPTFQAPQGWTAPADLLIPTGFVPVEGESLVIPQGVQVPEGTELPDFFKPNSEIPVDPKPEVPVEPGVPGEPDTPVEPEPEPEEPVVPDEGDNPIPGVPTDPEEPEIPVDPEPEEPVVPEEPTDDRDQPSFEYSFSHYHEEANSLLLIGNNLDSILGPDETRETDIKERIDWSKVFLSNYFYGDEISFELNNIESVYIERDLLDLLKIKFTDDKASEIREEFLYWDYRDSSYDQDWNKVIIRPNFIHDKDGKSFEIPAYQHNLAVSYNLNVEDGALVSPFVSPAASLSITPSVLDNESPSTIQATVDGENILSKRIWVQADDGDLRITNLSAENTELSYSPKFNASGETNITASGSGLSYVRTQDGNDTIISTNPNGTYFDTGGGNDTLIGGDGNDVFLFSSEDLTKEDSIDGGYGFNYLDISGDAIITDDQFTNIKNIQNLRIQDSGDHTVSLGELAGKSFRGNIKLDISSNSEEASSFIFDASTATAEVNLDTDLSYGDSIVVQGGQANDYFYFSGDASVQVKFAESAALNGRDYLSVSEKNENVTLDFSDFLGASKKTAVVADMQEGLDLSVSDDIGIIFNTNYGLHSSDISTTKKEGKITIADNSKAVVLSSSRSDADFADRHWSIHYIEDINPDPEVQDWNIELVGEITISGGSAGFTANELAELYFL